MKPPIGAGETWRMVVYGVPIGQGSMTAVPVMRKDSAGRRYPVMGKGGFPVINVTASNEKRLKPWRQEIAGMAVLEWGPRGECALDEAVFVRLCFYVERPDGHFGTGRNQGVLKDSSPLYPETTGDDLDKMERAVLDALSGIVWTSDKRVVSMPSRRRFGAPARVEIAVRRVRVRTVGDLRRLRETEPDLAEDLARQLSLELAAA